VTAHLRVDPIRCEAYGYCAELLPEHVRLDDWGYPSLDGRPLASAHVRRARRAATLCPRLALRLAAAESPAADRKQPDAN
jgi:ferredoxin